MPTRSATRYWARLWVCRRRWHCIPSSAYADEGIQCHRRRQTQSLAQYLVALRVGIAREVGNVERQGRPVADVRGQGREEKRPEHALFLAARLELGRLA